MIALLLHLAMSQVNIIDHGKNRGQVKTLSCVGGTSCLLNSHGWVEIATAADAGTVAIPSCGAGSVTTGNGTTLSCVSNVATATALAANPADCSAGQYATTIAANGDLSCAAVSYSQLSGSPTAGGSSPQMQYNNSGVLGGVTNYTSDGTNIIVAGSTSAPSAPGSGSTMFDHFLASAFPAASTRMDSFMGIPVPTNMSGGRNGILAPGGSLYNWLCQAHSLDTWNVSTIGMHVGEAASVTTQVSTAFAYTWDAGSLTGRIRHFGLQTSASNNATASYYSPALTSWRGNSSGAGGFVWMSRFIVMSSLPSQNLFAGMLSSVSTLSGQPSAQLNSVYLGCDSTGASPSTNLQSCSNDGAGSATCTKDLGAGFPCRTLGAVYDVWFAAPANGGSISWYVERLDTGATDTGTFSSDLPVEYAQLAWHTSLNNGADGGTNAVRLDFSALLGCDNW